MTGMFNPQLKFCLISSVAKGCDLEFLMSPTQNKEACTEERMKLEKTVMWNGKSLEMSDKRGKCKFMYYHSQLVVLCTIKIYILLLIGTDLLITIWGGAGRLHPSSAVPLSENSPPSQPSCLRLSCKATLAPAIHPSCPSCLFCTSCTGAQNRCEG